MEQDPTKDTTKADKKLLDTNPEPSKPLDVNQSADQRTAEPLNAASKPVSDPAANSFAAPVDNSSSAPNTSVFSSPPAADTPPLTPPKRSKAKTIIVILLAFILLAAAGYGIFAYFKHRTKTAAPPKVKVGVMMAFTGGSSSMGYGAMKGIQLAKKQLAANNIEIIQMDSKCDPKTAAEAIKKLIEQQVAAIIGEGCSSASVAALPAANNSKTIMISPSASSPALSIPDDYFFRVVPPDTFQGEYMAQAIFDKGIRTVGVFYTNEPYGTGMNKVFQEKFEALGGKVVKTVNAEPDVIDLSSEMKELKDANPEAVFFAPNSVVSGTAAIKLGREAGITVPFFGADIFYDTTIIDNAPTATEGLTITSFPTGSKSFKQALINEYQVSEQLYAAPQAYDAFRAIYLAVEKGATTGEAIKKELSNIEFDGASAHIHFDQNGEISDKNYKYDLLQIQDGKFTVLTQQ